jgi:hypothetical protein
MGQIKNRKGAGMKISIEVKYDKDEVAAMVLTAHLSNFGIAPEGMKWSVEASYSGRFEVKAVDVNETEGASE